MKLRYGLAVLAVLGLSACSGAPAKAGPAANASKTGKAFGAFDNTTLRNVNLTAFGLTKSNVVYEPPMVTKAALAGTLPDQTAFKTYVRSKVSAPGPVVLGFESLYLAGNRTAVTKRFNVLYATAKWAHEAAPGHLVGFYGLNGHTDLAHYGALARKLATREDAFFPTLYTFNDDQAAWTAKLRAAVAEAHATRTGLPVFPYLWAQYHPGTPKQFQWLTGARWTQELTATWRYADGFVVWSMSRYPVVPAADLGWVTATRVFAAAHHI